MNKLVVLSDIHGNLSALRAVVEDFQARYTPDGLILLGDLIDYGMRSNEVIGEIKKLESQYAVICNLWGNHEGAAIYPEKHLSYFSSDRGRAMLTYTRRNLSKESIAYLQKAMECSGRKVLMSGDKKLLCVHGDLKDFYWGKMERANLGTQGEYADYDYVFSGHTHIPHHMEIFYEADLPELRNRKKTVFLNPGSVGQPRNLNNRAQFAVLDMENEQIVFEKTAYDIDKEQAAFCGRTDDFYRERLRWGI